MIGFAFYLTFLDITIGQLPTFDHKVFLLNHSPTLTFPPKALGYFIIGASLLSVIFKLWINNYNLNSFDKIQLAIERNINLQKDDITFYDPMFKGPNKKPIKSPVISFNPLEKKLIRLLYNMHPRDIALVINGHHSEAERKGLIKLILSSLIAVACTVLIIIYNEHFNTRWNWLLFGGMVLIAVSLLVALYNFNVWISAGKFNRSKYQNLDKSILFRFSLLIENSD